MVFLAHGDWVKDSGNGLFSLFLPPGMDDSRLRLTAAGPEVIL
jgi:hypothetical protein